MAIGYAVGSDFGGLTMCSSLFAGTDVTAPPQPHVADARVDEVPGAFWTDAKCRWFAIENAVSV